MAKARVPEQKEPEFKSRYGGLVSVIALSEGDVQVPLIGSLKDLYDSNHSCK